jgi:glycosyltransferase involved in cell wall biosynthesis
VAPDQRRKVAVAFHEPVVGGAAIAVLRVLPQLEERGWEFTFWVPGPGALHDELTGRGYPVAGEERQIRYSRAALAVPPGAARRLASVPGYLRRFRRWVSDEAPALLQANTLITIPEALAVRRTRVPVLMYVHEILPADTRGTVAGRLIRACTDVVLTNSRVSVAALQRGGVEPRMAYYGIELPPDGLRTERARPPVVVGTLGTISDRKGSDVFLAASRLLQAERADVEFRMVGPLPDGSERAWSEDVVARAQAAGIRWSVTTDAFRELADWDVLVLPSRREPFGLVVIEAMAMRLPVVASGIDGPREIVTPECGLLVSPGDAAELAAAIGSLAGDPARREAMGRAGRARVEETFTLDTQAEAVHQAYLATRARRRA